MEQNSSVEDSLPEAENVVKNEENVVQLTDSLKDDCNDSKDNKDSVSASCQSLKSDNHNVPEDAQITKVEDTIQHSNNEVSSHDDKNISMLFNPVAANVISSVVTSNLISAEKKPESCGILSSIPEITVKKVGRKRKRKVINDDCSELEKEKYAVDSKLKNLQWTLNQSAEVSGKRQKKAPERFELSLSPTRRASVEYGEGNGDTLGSIPWIVQQLRDANIYTLRLLHRVIFRKQGMFSEKHIKKSVITFRGFPFDLSSPELMKRRDPLEKANMTTLTNLCDLLGVKCGTKPEMVDGIIRFLHHPSRQEVENFLKDVVHPKLEQQKNAFFSKLPYHISPFSPKMPIPIFPEKEMNDSSSDSSQEEMTDKVKVLTDDADVNSTWKKPSFFIEGSGVKLKFMKAVKANILVATDSFIELLHQLLFLTTDEKHNMRQNILEFSGFKCIIGSADYVYRTKLLSVLPSDQIKFLCRVLCLPTWHKSRQVLLDRIMDFLATPRVSVLKKKFGAVTSDLPKNMSDSARFSDASLNSPENVPMPFDFSQKMHLGVPKFVESEEIEIVPDIHIPEEALMNNGRDYFSEINDDIEVKLKNFSNIHYQVISTPAAKLNDVHMILYFKQCPMNVIRKNILEFSGYPFHEHSIEYQNRRIFMEEMSIEDLKLVATVLCLSQYVIDMTKNNIIQAVLKFLLKPSVLFSSSCILPFSTLPCKKSPYLCKGSDSPWEYNEMNSLQANKLHSEYMNYFQGNVMYPYMPSCSSAPDLNAIHNFEMECSASSVPQCQNPTCVKSNEQKSSVSKSPESESNKEKDSSAVGKQEVSLNESPVKESPAKSEKTENKSNEEKEKVEIKKQESDLNDSLAKVKKTEVISITATHFESGEDDDEDKPLSKLIGHPNDDQLKFLIAKIIKESKLEDITMKQVIRAVFHAYPNFDLGYRRGFIKSVIRQILSQMDEQSCSVSTTVLTI